MEFREAERRYAEIKREREAGALTDEEFDEQLKHLMVEDEEGRWWVKSRRTGDWHYHDGTAWIKGTPPGYQSTQVSAHAPTPPHDGPSPARAQAPTYGPTTPRRGPVFVVLSVLGLIVAAIVVGNNISNTTVFPTERESDYGVYYANGSYHMYAEPDNSYVLVGDAGVVQDGIVEVDATLITGDEDAAVAVVCRARDLDNYYSLGTLRNGHAFIRKSRNDEYITLAGGDHSVAIGGDLTAPHIRGECVGSRLTLYVNGQKIEEVEDSEFEAGEVGLWVNAGPDATTLAHASFDNFEVHAPLETS
jgi:hypothetical protein